MIDTIVLALAQDMYYISEPHKFTPPAQWVLTKSTKRYTGIQSKQNPTKTELLTGVYKPRLTLAHRTNFLFDRGLNRQTHDKLEPMLKIEFSAPKLIYGNNFSELQYKDFKQVIEKLATVLKIMGVIVTPQTLANSPVLAIHYSKNIPLTDGSTPYHYINKIKEANVKLSLDTDETNYRNDGHSYRWRCNSYEVIFYDKIRDLEYAQKSSKRALEHDSTLQQHIFKKLEKRNKLEFLRMEVRLNKRTKIKQLFKLLDVTVDLTLKKLFKPAISKKILLYYLNELESKRFALLEYKPRSDKALLADLIINNPKTSISKILQLFGLKKALETVTLRELRTMFSKYNQRSWYRLMADAHNIKLPAIHNAFVAIRNYIIKFKPTKLPSIFK